jgi:hypothetical protein
MGRQRTRYGRKDPVSAMIGVAGQAYGGTTRGLMGVAQVLLSAIGIVGTT